MKKKLLKNPIVLIWLPNDDHTFGHTALQTNKYYISFWPFTGKTASTEVGRLHFHEIVDFTLEGKRKPTSRHEIVNVTNEAINRIYEKFLRYNGIKPAEVSLVAAVNVNNKTACCRELRRTRYSLVGDVIIDKGTRKNFSGFLFFIKRCLTPGWGNIDICRNCISKVTANQLKSVDCPYYHKPQSCVSFCFNLIEMADPRPLVCLVEARHKTRTAFWYPRGPILFLGSGGICLEITVLNFEKHVVQKYWKKHCRRDHYNVFDFQKRTRFLMLLENLFKKVLMVAPTMISLSLLLEFFNCSYLELFGVTWIIHLMYFVLLYFVQVKLFPFVRLPKVVAFIGGFPCIILLFQIFFLNPIKNNLFDLEMLVSNNINYWGFLYFVGISEFIIRFLVDIFID